MASVEELTTVVVSCAEVVNVRIHPTRSVQIPKHQRYDVDGKDVITIVTANQLEKNMIDSNRLTTHASVKKPAPETNATFT